MLKELEQKGGIWVLLKKGLFTLPCRISCL